MVENYGLFGPCILLREVYSDDLGRLFRAAVVEDGSVDRTAWLRVFGAPHLPAQAIEDAMVQAEEIAEHLNGSQLAGGSFFLTEDGVPAVGCDYVAGQPLNRTLERARDEAFPFQPDNALLVAEKIAQALATVETVELDGVPLAHGFLHPGLVLLSNDGEVTVTAVGLGSALASGLSRPEAAPGARAYMAPEVLAGEAPTVRSDVYSVGAILFHLLTGTALPGDPDARAAALDAGLLSWDGEAVPDDIRSILDRALAPTPGGRYESAAKLRSELDDLVFGGAYSPTTFNLALFMDRLFRAEIEADELAVELEKGIDPTLYITAGAAEEDPAAEAPLTGPEPEVAPVATSEPWSEPRPSPNAPSRWPVWAGIGAAAVIVVAGLVYWLGGFGGPSAPPPPPTPTPQEIAAQRRAQEDRLRSLTQEMVQSMMAEREEEIRQELVARQSRIEELQRRLQQSEARAATSAAAARDEAATQQALMDEIQQQEAAQRAQQDALESERQQALEQAADTLDSITEGSGASAAASTSAADAAPGPDVAAPTPLPPTPSPTPAELDLPPRREEPQVAVGDFIALESVDTRPVIIKSQPLEWPRNAARSKGRGVVVVRLTVNAQGGVEDVTVLRADHTGWGIPEAAMEAARGYRFKPGTKAGVAITTHAFVTWRYDFTGDE
ncbi:MAG: TonB family protein [Thermoanaerobaculales bacterium]|nr:TonB family protein [Thermoanaerobaculales bacterium]